MLNMSEPVSLTFIFGTVGAIVVLVALGIVLVNRKMKKIKEQL